MHFNRLPAYARNEVFVAGIFPFGRFLRRLSVLRSERQMRVKDAAAAANKFTRKLGEQTNIVGGVADTSKLTDGNIGVVSNGTDTLNIKLAKDVKVDSVTTGNTVINNNGLTVGGKIYVTNNGINANNAPITNVASGGTTDSNAANIGDVKKAVAGAKATVTGDKQATVTNTTAADGHTDYVVSATKTTLAAEAGGKVSVTGGTEDANGVIAYTVGLDAATKTAINNIGGGTIAAGDNKTVTGDTVNTYLNNNYYDKPTMDTKLGDKANTNMDNITNAGKTVINDIAADAVKVVNGKNTTVTPGTEAGANGTVKTYAVNVSGDLTGITSISNQKTAPGGTTTGAKITLGDTTNTVNVGGAQINNVADGTAGTDAVNVNQLNDVKALAGKHTTIKAKDANVTVTEGTNGDGGKEFTVGLGNVVTVGQTHPVTVNGDAGTVNGLTNTTWDIDNPQPVSGQAATEDQLKTVSDGVKTNKTNITKNANDITNINTTIGKGLNFKGDDATVINKKLGEQLDIKGGADASKLSDGNIGVVSGNGALNIKLAKDVKVDSVTTGNTVINNNGLTVGGKTYVTNNGINANNQKVTNVADGQVAAGSKDAVNGGQLHDAKNEVINKGLRFDADNNSEKTNKLGSKVTVNGDNNITTEITQTGDDTKIGVKLNEDIHVKTVTAADTVKAGGVTMGSQTSGGTTGNYVTGLDNKTWNVTNPTAVSGRAATEDQLKTVTEAINNQSAAATDYRLVQNASSADGSYTVDTNGNIDFTVEDKNHAGQKETVKLKDIASKSKLDDVIAKGLQFDANAGGTKTNKLGSKITVKGEGTAADTEYSGENLKTFITQDPAGNTTIDVKMNKNLKVETIVATGENGKDGKIGINGKDGVTTNISVTRDGKPGVDGAPGTTTTRIVYEKPDGTKEEVATLNDGMKYGGDTGAVIKKKLNEQVNVVGGITDTNKLTTEDNLGVVSDGNNNLKVRMAKDLKGLNSVTTNTLTVGDVKIDNSGINAGNKKITNVAAGDISANSTDAVNGGQLWKTNQTINNIGGAVNELGTRVNRVGAGAAALAALHPLDFDPDDKWDVAAGYGNYKDAHAVAVGAFYRPNEDTMFSVGGSFGGGENMVNAGVSVKLGQGNHVSTSKVAMAKEIVDLRDENKDLKKRLDTMEQKMNSILGILDMGKKKDFPDVPENHWAYEYVATLAGNGILEGYPDGMFGGDRTMTRYEFAAMFYRALKNGAPVDDNMDRAMNEFEPELRQIRLDRIRVDRISGKDNDRNKVERVRVNSEDDKAKNDYRDVYGSHISPKV